MNPYKLSHPQLLALYNKALRQANPSEFKFEDTKIKRIFNRNELDVHLIIGDTRLTFYSHNKLKVILAVIDNWTWIYLKTS